MRIGNSPFQNNVPIGNGSGVTVNAMSNMFTPPIGGGGPSPLSSNSFTRPPYGGSSDVTDLSAAELYCQQHEVTASVCTILFAFVYTTKFNFLIQIIYGQSLPRLPVH
jgi:ATP-dependent RNA helicase DDX5/DBP2